MLNFVFISSHERTFNKIVVGTERERERAREREREDIFTSLYLILHFVKNII